MKHEFIKEKRTILWYLSSWWYRFFWNYISDLKWKIPNVIHRAYYGWGKADTWSFDVYLAKIISQGVKYLKKTKTGVPCEIFDKYGDEFAEMEWNKVLDKIIRAFELHIIQANDRFLTKEEKKEYNEGLQLFIKHFGSLWS